MSARTADFSQYKTVLSPELFQIAWEPFYRTSLAASNELKQRYRNVSDIAYGPSPFQTLDLYFPDEVKPDTPTVVFLHGGAFREGHPGQYGFLAKPYLERGVAFISAGYRLAPEAFYPDHVEDVGVLMKWLAGNLPAHGLDPRRVVMSGHSSGALMIALAAVRTDWQARYGLPIDALDYAVTAGANYDHSTDFPQNLVRDPARRDEGTVLRAMTRAPKRQVIVFGVDERNTGDGRRFERSGRPLAAELEKRGTKVDVFALDTDHQGTCAALADPDGAVFAAVMDVVAAAKART